MNIIRVKSLLVYKVIVLILLSYIREIDYST